MAIISFGPKTAWIAARGASPEAVIAALSLRDVRRVPWGEGAEAAYRTDDRIVFVTTPVDGWVLAFGWALMDQAEEDAAQFARDVADWARRLDTEVVYFTSHRVVELHGWARARPAGRDRAFLYIGERGETVVDEGPPTAEEVELGYARFDAERAGDEWRPPDEDVVFALAARWSVDPSSLEPRSIDVGEGWMGTLAASAGSPSAVSPPPPPRRPWWKFW